MGTCPTHYIRQPCALCADERRQHEEQQRFISKAHADHDGRVRAEAALLELARMAGVDVGALTTIGQPGEMTGEDVLQLKRAIAACSGGAR